MKCVEILEGIVRMKAVYLLTVVIVACVFIDPTLISGKNGALLATAQTNQSRQLRQERERRPQSEVFNRAYQFSSAGDSLEVVRASVESVANFLRERGGIVLSSEIKQRVAYAEKNVLDGKSRRLSVDDLIDLAADVLALRLSVITDEEIEEAVKVLRGDFNAKDLRLRYDGSAMTTVDEISRDLRSLRTKGMRNNGSLRNMAREMIRGGELRKGIKGYDLSYRLTLPEIFGNGLESGLTPLQSLLILYSAASDDPVDVPTDFFRKMMDEMYRGSENIMPNPKGRPPFGSRGYLFPMPLDLVFD